MNSVRFLLDGELTEISQVDPTRTVLQFLREDRLRTGSKEGCAEGDCGACTVVLGELINQQIRYRAVNACIQFLPTLDGKALFTVESLQSDGGQLHPVQQSLVDNHGSQCGFCTPGFVMSMFALYQNDDQPSRATIDDALSGNLCRCTGYRPIVEACQRMHDYPKPDSANRALIEKLSALQRDQSLTLTDFNKRYFAPTDLQDLAQRYLEQPDAQLLAGGTDMGLWVTKQLRELPSIIYLGNVIELQQISDDPTGIEIGAAVSLTDAIEKIALNYPELEEMFRRFASPPVRNAGTLVGNLANGSPIGDSMPALISINAQVNLRCGDSTRQIALEDLYLDYQKTALGPGEFVQSVRLPVRDPKLQLRCYKLSKRYDQDISAVCAAFSIKLDGDSVEEIVIAMGGMAATPRRAPLTEGFLLGKSWNEKNLREAMALIGKDFFPLSDMRASADYRTRAAANLLYRFYLQTRTDNPLADESVSVFANQNMASGLKTSPRIGDR